MQAHLRTDRAGTRVEIATAEQQKPVEGVRVPLRQCRFCAQPSGELVQLRACSRDARPAGEVGTEGLGGIGIVLLGQIADCELRRQPAHRSCVGLLEPGEDAKERRLAGTVRTDQADATARRHDERDVVQDELRGVVLRDVGGGESATRGLQERTSSERRNGRVCVSPRPS